MDAAEGTPTKTHAVLAALAFLLLFFTVFLIGSRKSNGCAAHEHQHKEGSHCAHE